MIKNSFFYNLSYNRTHINSRLTGSEGCTKSKFECFELIIDDVLICLFHIDNGL